MMHRGRWWWLGMLLSLPDVLAQPTLGTDVIVEAAAEATTAMSCVDYRVVGGCLWLTCAGYYCETEVTTKVGHYIPDVVVSAYAQPGANPWEEARPIVESLAALGESAFGDWLAGHALGGGNAINGERGNGDTGRVRFKNVDIIGNPVASMGLTCNSVATAFEPYFVSDADLLAWRFGIPEIAYASSWNLYGRNIEKGNAVWGPLFPRAGALVQNHDYKAAAVMAQRAANTVTQDGQPHVYVSLAEDAGEDDDQYRWPPGELVEGDADTGHWQMLLPNRETDCYVFADVDDTLRLGLTDPHEDRLNVEFGDYVWNLWRPYACCDKPDDAVALIAHWGTYP